jgi:hypothetical protein
MFSAICLQSLQMRKLAVFAVMAVVMAGCGSKPSAISYQHEKVSNGPWSIHVVKFDRSQRDLELRTTLSQETIFGLSTLVEQVRALPQQAGSPVAALNGRFLCNRG